MRFLLAKQARAYLIIPARTRLASSHCALAPSSFSWPRPHLAQEKRPADVPSKPTNHSPFKSPKSGSFCQRTICEPERPLHQWARAAWDSRRACGDPSCISWSGLSLHRRSCRAPNQLSPFPSADPSFRSERRAERAHSPSCESRRARDGAASRGCARRKTRTRQSGGSTTRTGSAGRAGLRASSWSRLARPPSPTSGSRTRGLTRCSKSGRCASPPVHTHRSLQKPLHGHGTHAPASPAARKRCVPDTGSAPAPRRSSRSSAAGRSRTPSVPRSRVGGFPPPPSPPPRARRRARPRRAPASAISRSCLPAGRRASPRRWRPPSPATCPPESTFNPSLIETLGGH